MNRVVVNSTVCGCDAPAKRQFDAGNLGTFGTGKALPAAGRGGLLDYVILPPIVERELRVAARKRSTYWVRLVGALVALVIGSGFLVLEFGFGSGGLSLGRGLFGALTWLSLAAALSAGLFLTADCLSEEKREGTLGLLFLTDLRGHDVVLGKLLATSLRGFYALLAVFPILAVTLLMGGVAGPQFWKTSLALVNALFVSLAAGLFVSAISRDSQKALAATLLLLLLLVAGGPVGDGLFADINNQPFQPILSLGSPGYLFVAAGGSGKTPFWPALLGNQLAGWFLFGLACLLVPRTWHDKVERNTTARQGWAAWWKFGGLRRQATLRRKLVDKNPVLWLTCRERWQAWLLWTLTILLATGFAAVFVNGDESAWLVWSYLGGVFTLVLYLGVASQAGRFFVEARRSGLIELLLATPLTGRQIVQGQWRAVVRVFGMPLIICLTAQMLGTFLVQQAWRNIATTVPPIPPATAASTNAAAATNVILTTTTIGAGTVTVSRQGPFVTPGDLVTLVAAAAGALAVATNLVALVWFGMWMGLNSKNSSMATLKTILFVQIIPWFVISFASMLVVPLLLMPALARGAASAAAPSQVMIWYPLLVSGAATVLVVTKDLGFTLWARRKLYADFRERASRTGRFPRMAPASPAPPLIAPPLVSVR